MLLSSQLGYRREFRSGNQSCPFLSQRKSPFASEFFVNVPMTPDPNTSGKVSRYKWEPYRDTNWWCISTTL